MWKAIQSFIWKPTLLKSLTTHLTSEESYNNLIENVYVMGNKSNYDWLMESKEQLESGKYTKHDLIEVQDE